MELSIIIVNYNTKDLLRQCLESLRLEAGGLKLEIIVVDNASSDDSAKMVKKEFSKVSLIKNKENLGFAKAVNQALRRAQGKYILLLNPDIEVRKGSLEKLIRLAKRHPEVGIIAGRLFNPDETVQGSCFHRLTIMNAIREFWLGQKGAFEKYAPKTEEPVEVEAVVGACMLIPKKVVDRVGLFDKRFFLYFEDLDYCRRVRKAGFKIYYLPQAEFVHHHGASGKDLPVSAWLKKSSKIYHGEIKYYLLTLIIWLGQKWQRKLIFS